MQAVPDGWPNGCSEAKLARLTALAHWCRAALAAPLLCIATATLAQSPQALPGEGGVDPVPPKTYYEQGILIRAGEVIEPLGPNLMGDAINEYSGGVEFTHTDVALPGNHALPVAVGRHRALGAPLTYGGGLFGDWDLEIPRLHSVATQAEPGWYGAGNKANYNRCSQFREPPSTYVIIARDPLSYSSNAFWDGYHLYVPGSGDQTLLRRSSSNPIHPSDGTAATYPVVTKNHWQLSCLPSLENGPGEGFLARSPDGTTYRFDHMAVRAWPHVKVSGMNLGVSGIGFIDRVEVSILPTLVTDRFGNWVRYTYSDVDVWRVESITSSDGRKITFGYSGTGRRVQSVSDGTRTWRYGYDSSTGALQTVTLPDASEWQFALQGVGSVPFSFPDPDCDGGEESGTIDYTARTGTITHPSGAVGAFTLKSTYHGRSNVPGSQATCTFTNNPVSRYFVSRSLASKTLSGPGMPAMTWNYDYSTASGSFKPCNGCVNTKTVTVTDPLNHVTVSTYGTQYGIDEGLLLKRTEGTVGSSALRSTSLAYASSSAGPFPSSVGSGNHPADSMSGSYRPQRQRTITQQGVNFTQTATGFDVYARPTGMTRASSLGHSRTESTTYFDQTALWVLGQVERRTIAGVLASQTTFDPGTALPAANYAFGQLTGRYRFNADGTLESVTDALAHTTTFSHYKRGLAQRIDYADGSFITGVVNNLGLLDSVTNEAGTTWTYGYDKMGRLASKTPPAGDAVAYHPTTLSFVQVPTAEVGLEPNHWRQTITEGNAVTVHYFDARWRKRITSTYDAASPSTTRRMQLFHYDPDNRPVFASYPARSIASVTADPAGTSTTYDALGRPIRTLADSELGVLETTTQYLAGFQTQVKNPRGFATRSAFQAFDDPDEAAIAAITAPEGVSVAIERDAFGKPLSITRAGSDGTRATRRYVYDLHQRLCKSIEPESGATVQDYDAAGNLAWRASGLNLPGPACDQASVPSVRKIVYEYDERNRQTRSTHGDGSPTVSRTYTADGLPRTLGSAGLTWTYGYNKRRLLISETLKTPASNEAIVWDIDAHGHVGAITYPDGDKLAYAPNALGEPSRVGSYATQASWHPNGQLAAYTLGNGVRRTVSQNLRGLPEQWRDTGAAGTVVQDRYAYDANANVAAITDDLLGTASRSLGYDGLDRLSQASGVWGGGSFAYDALDNLRSSTLGAKTLVHHIDPTTNRLTSLSGSQAIALAYDANGNVARRGAQGFTFDIANRLASAAGLASYTYDGAGRRTLTAYANGQAVRHLYSREGRLLQTVHSSLGTTQHVYLGQALVAEVNSKSGTSYVHTDALGSPVAKTNASGQVLSRTRYAPYGATAAGTNPKGIGFTGHVNDADTGLVYMQQRYYDPIAGRFLSVDPVTTNASDGSFFNRYVYANNNPYKFKDPDGNSPAHAAAFVLGFAIDVGAQMLVEGKSFGDVSFGDAALSGLGAAITGGIGGRLATSAMQGAITTGQAVAGTAAAGAVAGAGVSAASDLSKGQAPSAAKMAIGAAGGAAGAAAGAKIANSAAAKLTSDAAKPGVAGHIGQTTQAAAQQGGRVVVPTSVGQEVGKAGADAAAAGASKLAEKELVK